MLARGIFDKRKLSRRFMYISKCFNVILTCNTNFSSGPEVLAFLIPVLWILLNDESLVCKILVVLQEIEWLCSVYFTSKDTCRRTYSAVRTDTVEMNKMIRILCSLIEWLGEYCSTSVCLFVCLCKTLAQPANFDLYKVQGLNLVGIILCSSTFRWNKCW